MKEHGILFTDQMVQAILAGRKTVTRRLSCRYRPGDRLYVKEAHQFILRPAPLDTPYTYLKGPAAQAAPDQGGLDAQSRSPWTTVFRAGTLWLPTREGRGFPWRSGLFMPKWASRVWLGVVSVEESRLSDMDDAEARREGVENLEDFKALWAKIHGAWQPDLLVHRLEFSPRTDLYPSSIAKRVA